MALPDNSQVGKGEAVNIHSKKQILVILAVVVLQALVAWGCRTRLTGSAENGANEPEKSTSQSLAEADALYGQRQDIANARRGIIVLRQARTRDNGNYEAAWKLARLDYYLGSHSKDDSERDAAFRDGIEAGKAAVLIDDHKPDGHFWLGANYGGSAEMSVLASLSSFVDIRTQMQHVLDLDESYESGSAYLGMGELYLKAPRVLGGDSKKAVEYLEKGLRFGATNALLHLRLAEAYHAVGRDQDAQKQIDFILKMPANPAYAAEYDDAVAGAKVLEKRIQL